MTRRTTIALTAATLTLALGGCQSTSGGSSSSSSSGGSTGGSSGGAAAAGGLSGGANQGEACTASMEFANFDLDHPSDTISGAAKVICLDAPDFITHTLYLEYQSAADPSNTWHLDSPDGQQTQHGYNPDAGFIVYARCRVATWRLRYKAIGVDAAKMPIDINYTSPKLTVFVPRCP